MAKGLRAPRVAPGPAPKPTALAPFPGFPETSASFGTQPFSLCPFLIFPPPLSWWETSSVGLLDSVAIRIPRVARSHVASA